MLEVGTVISSRNQSFEIDPISFQS